MRVSSKYIVLVAIGFLLFLCSCKKKDPLVSEGPAVNPARLEKLELIVRQKEPVFSLDIFGNNVAWSQSGEDDSLGTSLFVYNSKNKKTKLIYEVDKSEAGDKQAMPVKINNDYILWCEYFDDEEGIVWDLCLLNLTNGDSKVIIATNRENKTIQPPNFSINEKNVVYDMFIPNPEDSYDSPINIYGIKEKKLVKKIELKGFDLHFPAAGKEYMVFSKIKGQEESIISEISLYNFESGELAHPEVTKSGYQPHIYGNWVVYKEAESPYYFGAIKAFECGAEKGAAKIEKLTEGDLPYIGSKYTVSHPANSDVIRLYDFKNLKLLEIYKGACGSPVIYKDSLAFCAIENEENVIYYKKI